MGARGSGGEADGMRILRYGAATAAALAITTATSAVPGPARAAGAATVSWHACEGTGLDPRQECATLRVPLDYRRPDGPRIELAISRIPSERPEKRRGVLLLIPGGPGNPGLDRPSAVDDELPAAVREAYDIVGFDPRGVGHSTPISCDLSREDLAPANQRPWPAPDGDISGNVTTERRIARTCAQRGGDLIRNISTVNEARDIDRIRRALGEAKISAWGVSYGTYVGAVYTAVFPQHTDRVVLDSNDDPDPVRVERAWLANYAVGVEDRFPDFATWASKADNPYRLAANPGAVRSLFTALAARLDREPIPWPGADPPRLSGNVLRETLLDDLYDDDDFPSLATLIRAARDSRPLPEPSSPPDAVLPEHHRGRGRHPLQRRHLAGLDPRHRARRRRRPGPPSPYGGDAGERHAVRLLAVPARGPADTGHLAWTVERAARAEPARSGHPLQRCAEHAPRLRGPRSHGHRGLRRT
jgi:pimeloyl-ACP methyl ester carboxylesterase